MSRVVKIGKISIGGDNPIAVQTMTNVKMDEPKPFIDQLQLLEAAGADVIRTTVNTDSAVEVLKAGVAAVNVPIVADIHFDYRLAIKSCIAGAAKIRFNPGNIGSKANLLDLLAVCKDRRVPIRVGVNMGSIEKDMFLKYGRTPEALAESALKHVRIMEEQGFYDTVVSVKSSDVNTTVKAYRIISQKTDYPLHLGVTEAGGGDIALIKSSIGIGSLLIDGIGDTIRVSLSDDPLKEIEAGKNILRSLGLQKNFVEIISCPTCGRTEYDVIGTAARMRELTKNMRKPIKIAVMGCVVNGIGEGQYADFGVAGGKNRSVIFEKGAQIAVVDNNQVEETLLDLLAKHLSNG